MKKRMISVIAVIAALSLAGCGSSETKSTDNAAETTAAATTVTTAAPAETTETVSETEAATEQSAAETSAAAETAETEQKSSFTTVGDFEKDLDAMIASAEAEIPDITVFTGMKDIEINIGNKDKDKTTTTTAAAAKKPETTTTVTTTAAKAETTAAAVTAPAGDVDSLFTVIFDGTKYSLPISGTLPLPAGWTVSSSAERSAATFENKSYEGCQIDELRKGGDALNGVFIAVIEAMKKGSAYPALQMYKGITWGSTVDEIKAQYGEPVHSKNYEQYKCHMTSMYYKDSNDSLMIMEVSEEYGLALIEFYRQ